jgi:hypothetical protein
MKFRILIVMIASVGLAVSGLANAVPITHNDYTLNPTTNIVTHTDGTEWLQWDVTKGQSILDALGAYAGEGWVLAGDAQMAELFGRFGWSLEMDMLEYPRFQAIDGSYTSGGDDSEHDAFLELFGLTESIEGGYYGYGIDSWMRAVVGYGIYDDDCYATTGSGDRCHGIVNVQSDSIIHFNGTTNFRNDSVYMRALGQLASQDMSYSGVALVRAAEVPEPASLLFLVLGTFGLALRRFKKQS